LAGITNVQPAAPEISTCPTCGGPLETTPEGGFACMSCLLRAGIGSEEEVAQGSTPNTFEGGVRFGVYEIDRRADGSLYELGRGAMGVTYRATDTSLQRKVALKIIKTDIAARSADARERFIREARAAAAFRHEHIATVYQFGMRLEAGQYFYVMELIEGETLNERVRRAGPLDARTTIGIAQQVTSALAAAEKHGLVHRDLKPANLMLVNVDEPKVIGGDQAPSKRSKMRELRKSGIPVIKIIDFGLAKAFHTATDPKSLTHDRFVGTPAFASPEQFEHSTLDVRSDIYSLGETLWFALTGKPPFAGRTLSEIHRAQKSNALPVEQLKAAHVPHRLKSLLESMLAFEPASRPGTRELAARLQRCSPEARSIRRTRVALAAAAIALAVAACWIVWKSEFIRHPVTLTAPEKSIAVLPFSDLSQTKDQEYFCDGISEELLDSLAKIEGLRVMARTSSFAFKGKNVSVEEIAAKLGVQHILEGSLRRDGNRIRLTAQLINARDGFHLWSQTYERELQGVFAVQDEITSAIVEALKVKLALAPPPRATVNTDAHELYLQGLYHSNKGNEEDLRKAIGLFQQALEKDPNFSRAWTGIAEAWIWLADEYVKPLEAYPAAEAAAKKALALNPADAYARSSLAEARHVLNWDLNGAIAEVERALAIDRNCSQAHFLLAELREAQGNCPAAIAEIHTTQQLDPLSAQLTSWATGVMIRCDRLDEALALAQRTIELDPSYLYFGPPLARVYVAQGKLEEARAIYEEGARRTHRPNYALAITYAKLGRQTEAREILRQMLEARKTTYMRPDLIASIYAALGEREEMFAWLEIAYNEHSSSLANIAFRRELRPFASEPRFVDPIRRMGLGPAALLNRERSE